MSTYTFKFSIGQRVEITAIDVTATVIGVSRHIHGDTYQVVYYFNGIRYDVWVQGEELSVKEEAAA